MKKKNVINLIKAYSEKNDFAFKSEAINIANIFSQNGDQQLSDYIMSLISDVGTFVPQNYGGNLKFLTKIEPSNKSLPLPKAISSDVIGLINAINKNIGLNKFIFYGAPGTGKTETAKHISRILNRELYRVNIEYVIDSKLGQTAKNISELFAEINSFAVPSKIIVLLDEIDSLVLDRTNDNDVREMGRATSTFLRMLDELNPAIVVIATTNLYEQMDKALLRRFDSNIDFSRYSKEDLIDLSVVILNDYAEKIDSIKKDTKLLKKIMNCFETIPYPSDLTNMIKTSIAFSDPNDPNDYMKRILKVAISGEPTVDMLNKKGFTLREIEVLTGISKSQLSRMNNKEVE